MIERTVTDAGGVSYLDVRFGEGHSIDQGLIDVSTLGAFDDADGYLPPGLPILATGAPVSAPGQKAYGLVGPEVVKLGTVDHLGNMIFSGGIVRDRIEANLGRVLTADELSAIAAGCPGIVLH